MFPIFSEVFEGFVKDHHVAIMVRMLLDNLLNADVTTYYTCLKKR